MWNPKYNESVLERRQVSQMGGGADRIDNQHRKGKMTARERLTCLFDKGSFMEINSQVKSNGAGAGLPGKNFPGDGVVIGYGTIDGRMVCASSQDFTVIGGTLGEYHSQKICRIMGFALKARCPYISINDSGGARIEEGIASLNGYSGIFYRNTQASGIIPQISIVLGPCAGGACYSPAITDYIFMARKTANMFITGPAVVKAVIGEDVSTEELGGARVHVEKSGVVHFVYNDDRACLDGVKKLLSYIPGNCDELPPDAPAVANRVAESIEEIVPDDQRRVYDVKQVISAIVDGDSFFEIQEDFARNIVIGFARIDGASVGIVANNPKGSLVGSLDIDSSEKAARFIRFCDCFNLPVLTLVDVPGFMPGKDQEHGGIIRRGAKLLYAYAEATIPKITLIMRKAFGGAYIAMNSKGLGADMVFAWPIAQTAVMGAEGAVSIMYSKQIATADNPELERARLIDAYNEQYMNPFIAVEKGYIDEIILPEETRQKISEALKALKNKDRASVGRRHHGNIPL